MIASLKGLVQEKSLERVIVEVGGVGYLVSVSGRTLAELPEPGEPVFLYCYTHVREDALQLYGFLQREEQVVFMLLITVSGIGPKLALTTLSGMSVRELSAAIARGDHRQLQTIPGVGKKTAERMVVELKERCAALDLVRSSTVDGASAPRVGAPAHADVVDALVNLGYKRPAAEGAVKRVLSRSDAQLSPERLLRDALSAIAEKGA